MSVKICKSYPLAALLINATGEEVTEERMKAIFTSLGLEYSSKKASMFCLPADKIKTMMHSIGSSQAAPAASSAPAAEATNENVPEDEGSSDESFDLGF